MGWFRETAAGAAVLACAALLLVPAVGGGVASAAETETETSEEITCVGDSCQPLPAEPEDPMPGTLVPNPGNPPLRFSEPKKTRHKAKRGGHRHGGRHKHGRGEAGRTAR